MEIIVNKHCISILLTALNSIWCCCCCCYCCCCHYFNMFINMVVYLTIFIIFFFLFCFRWVIKIKIPCFFAVDFNSNTQLNFVYAVTSHCLSCALNDFIYTNYQYLHKIMIIYLKIKSYNNNIKVLRFFFAFFLIKIQKV